MSVYIDNPLNKYESYTYSWAVHMCNPNSIDQAPGTLIKSGQVVTLAETGIENEISIEGVEQSFVLTFNAQDRRAIANKFKFSFTEVGGVTFFTRILKAARDLNIPNHMKATYILELNINAQQEGKPVRHITDGGPFYYVCLLTNLGMSIQTGASFYAGDFIEVKDQAFDKLDFTLISDVDIQASTYEEFLTKFQEELNKQAVNAVVVNTVRLFPNKYILRDEYGASSWVFGPVDPGELPVNRLVSVSGAAGNLTFSLKKGTAITSAMTEALMHTTNFRRMPVGNGSTFFKNSPNDLTGNPARYADQIRWVTYDTKIRYGQYDPVANNYQKEITYIAKPNLAPQAINDPNSYNEFNNSPAYQQAKINRMFINGQLKKRYDYIFTGKNTEVLDFDLSLNNTYYTMQSSRAPVYPQEYFANDATRTASADQGTLDRLKAELAGVTQRINDIGSRIGRRGMTVDRAAELIAPLQTEAANLETQITAAQAIATVSTTALQDAGFFGNSSPFRVNSKKYITQSQLYSGADLNSNNRTLLTPVTFRYDDTNNPGDAGPESGQQSEGAKQIAAMYQNLYATADLLQVGITIKGDPFWLGANYNKTNGANYERGGNAFFLNIRVPRYPNDNSGLMDIENQVTYMLSGVYIVLTGTATYRAGQFTMTLYAYKDMQTQTPLIYNMLNRGEITATDDVSNQPGVVPKSDESTTGNENARPGVSDNPIAPGVTGNSSPGGHQIDTNNVNPDLVSILALSGDQSGVTVVTTSGFRPDSTSGRHLGDANDIALYSGGRRLSVSNASDRAIIATFTSNFIDNSRDYGYTPSVGWANHTAPSSQWYMGGATGHYDIAVGNSIPGNRGTYWGNGESSAGAPSWLSSLF